MDDRGSDPGVVLFCCDQTGARDWTDSEADPGYAVWQPEIPQLDREAHIHKIPEEKMMQESAGYSLNFLKNEENPPNGWLQEPFIDKGYHRDPSSPNPLSLSLMDKTTLEDVDYSLF